MIYTSSVSSRLVNVVIMVVIKKDVAMFVRFDVRIVVDHVLKIKQSRSLLLGILLKLLLLEIYSYLAYLPSNKE